jgi:hypothetical protein
MGDNNLQDYDFAIGNIDYSGVEEQWWDVREESQAAVEHRLDVFVEELRTIPLEQTPIIAVGHSMFFREFFRRYAGEGAGEFQEKVLSNCGVVALTIDFQDDENPCIVSQRLIFTSHLISRPGLRDTLLMVATGPRTAAVASIVVLLCSLFEAMGGIPFRVEHVFGAMCLGILLAQALQRFLFSKRLWTVTPLWPLCAICVWVLCNDDCEKSARPPGGLERSVL